jgi:hypothetical protein
MTSQQQNERFYFQKFSRDYQLPPGAIVYGDKPDVIIEGQGRIGIEMTHLFLEDGSLPQSEQAQQKLRSAAVSHAHRIFSAGRRRGIEVTLDFNKDKPIRDTRKLARAIANLANKIKGQETGVVGREAYKDIPELSYVYLNAEEYDDPKWRLIRLTMGRMMSRERLLQIVRSKEVSVAGYKPCDAYWLLVVIEFFDVAQDQEIRVRGFHPVESNVFEKILVYKPAFGQVLEAK